MGLLLSFYQCLHWIFQNLCFHWSRWWPEPLGLIAVVVHRDILNITNLYPANLPPPRDGDMVPLVDPTKRPGDGYGTDKYNPSAGATGSPMGRNCPAIPSKERSPQGDPDVQMVAQRLLSRDGFHPAGDQLNILAAAWIQAMVHDWLGHYDGKNTVELNKGAASGCPMAKFKFFETKIEPDGSMNSFRTNWWDASFVYGNDDAQINRSRTFKGGKLKVGVTEGTLPINHTDGTYEVGDNKNSWVGVSLLQELFLREHNAIADAIGTANNNLSDEEIFDKSRLVIAALVAKIHTIDWTVELLKTYTLQIGMRANWMGLFAALSKTSKSRLPSIFKLIQKKKADNKGVPFCLTEEFAAVYRLHHMLPPGLVVGKHRDEFIPMEDLVGDKGRNTMKTAPPGRTMELWDSVLYYPCGNLVPHNYPVHLRKMVPTEESGKNLSDEWKIDLAALDLYRDRERGILRYNEFRRSIGLKPFTSWEALVGKKNTTYANELAAVYGPAPEGIEKLDLLVGSMYEEKLRGFAISETSFTIFLLMASRRLDSDPFLNEYYNSDYYTQVGLDWIDEVQGLNDLLERHYPALSSKIPAGQSAFKPYGTKEQALGAWAAADPLFGSDTKAVWEETKARNEALSQEPLEQKNVSQDYGIVSESKKVA